MYKYNNLLKSSKINEKDNYNKFDYYICVLGLSFYLN